MVQGPGGDLEDAGMRFSTGPVALPSLSGESFIFTVHAVDLHGPRIEISGLQGVQATFDWQATRDSAAGRMCDVTLVNDIEEY